MDAGHALKPGEKFYDDLPIIVIAGRIKLDRAIVKKRLDLHKYTPVLDEPKKKLYRFDPEMEARLLETDTKLSEAKTRQTLAAAEIAEMNLAERRGELASVAGFKDMLNQIFGAAYQEAVVRLPQRISTKLHKAKSAADVNAILTHELGKIFNDLRSDHAKFLVPAKKAVQKPARSKGVRKVGNGRATV